MERTIPVVIGDGFTHNLPDPDPAETEEWLEALDDVIEVEGRPRANYIMGRLLERASDRRVGVPGVVSTPYINTIPAEADVPYPGDEDLEKRIRRFIRWNAAVTVINANHNADAIGGHLSTYASSALLYEVGFNHFFRGREDGRPGDAVYFQGHASPGIYARAFVERRIQEFELDLFRRELEGGLSSYPHPRLMPEFWEYPTVSMGLGPINSIYQARFNKYLQNRGLDDTSGSRVWCFIGDGETDEPETLGSISLAGRERLDNLTWVINCNLQRLDGPVRGNGKIIQELEAIFRGAGWNVIKVIWGTSWDPLLARDTDGLLVEKMNDSVDGEYQRYKAESGAYIREHFFGPEPGLRKIVEDMTDDEIWSLRRGGLDHQKIYSAYHAATQHVGAPTVILAKTIKGWTLGEDVEGRNATHQIKKLNREQLLTLRNTLKLNDEIPDEALDVEDAPYYRPPVESPEFQYMMERREALGGPVPSRSTSIRVPLELPGSAPFEEVAAGSGTQAASTTMAFTRLLRGLTRDDQFGSRVVPIIPDEGRTFGWDALFKELGIYASQGQLYEPVDAKLLLSYREASDGQILEEGITEAGALSSWIAAATSYSTRGVPMVPFFIFYSMFGFQRVGDLIWLAADARARGFLLGATAGRTTLLGEGLQHQDGHSLVLASTVPVCQAYDPAFAYEMGVVIEDGLQRMYRDGEDIFYYLTLYNENYPQPPRPEGVEEGIRRGLYRFAPAPDGAEAAATILFSGSAHTAARQAQSDLAETYGVGAELFSATNYKLLREDALTVERWNRLHPGDARRVPYVTAQLEQAPGPYIAVSDYMTMVPDQVARWIPGSFTTLGTDGFGRSDTREALRRFFEIDTGHVVVSVLSGLAEEGRLDPAVVKDAIARYEIDPDLTDPMYR
ncbi:MAG: pyruvate dehydrogenase (acetyl-transferring), homodimeric type [Acidimicrobiia bacterium]|nr:pyruvate dehydrogenase (acetyl-transferring), homodimeric type [Acidimicrobiia bacterium]NNF09128.1 pyruvate dehydrogenase (acetyl-transferring), homodimeric type [Acidimicrobiia bacterium]NNL70475.1 pyruvate dehydrogenase (acetyl-transferring), homodimeric type [Acidimicrobiia bacterium]